MNHRQAFIENNQSFQNYLTHFAALGDTESIKEQSNYARELSFITGLIPGAPYDPTFDHKFRTYQYPHAFQGQSRFLGELIVGLAAADDLEFLLSKEYGLPIKRSDEMRFDWNVVKFDTGIMDIEPEEGVPRYLRASSSKDSTTVQRYGIGLYIEHNFWKTAAGAIHFMRSLIALEHTVRRTWHMNIIESIMNARSKMADYEIRERCRLQTQDWVQIIEERNRQFAIAQKFSDGAYTSTLFNSSLLSARGHRANAIYTPGGQIYFRGTGSHLTTYSEAGPGGLALGRKDPASITTFDGKRLCIIEDFQPDRNRGIPLNPMRGQYTFGQMFQLFGQDIDDISIPEYKSWHRSTAIVDYQKDKHVRIGLQDCLDHCFDFQNPDAPGSDEYPPGFHLGSRRVDSGELGGRNRFLEQRIAKPINEANQNEFLNDVSDLFACRDSSMVNMSNSKQRSIYRFVDMLGEMHKGFLSDKILMSMARKMLIEFGSEMEATNALAPFQMGADSIEGNNETLRRSVAGIVQKLFDPSAEVSLIPVAFGNPFNENQVLTRTYLDANRFANTSSDIMELDNNQAAPIVRDNMVFTNNDPYGVYETYSGAGVPGSVNNQFVQRLQGFNKPIYKGTTNMFSNAMYARMLALFMPETGNSKYVGKVSVGSTMSSKMSHKRIFKEQPIETAHFEKVLDHNAQIFNNYNNAAMKDHMDAYKKENADMLGKGTKEYDIFKEVYGTVKNVNTLMSLNKIVNGMWKSGDVRKSDVLFDIYNKRKDMSDNEFNAYIAKLHHQHADHNSHPIPEFSFVNERKVSVGSKLVPEVLQQEETFSKYHPLYDMVATNGLDGAHVKAGLFTNEQIEDAIRNGAILVPLTKDFNVANKFSDSLLNSKNPLHKNEIKILSDPKMSVAFRISSRNSQPTVAAGMDPRSTKSIHPAHEFGTKSIFNISTLYDLEKSMHKAIVQGFPEMAYYSFLSKGGENNKNLGFNQSDIDESKTLHQFILKAPRFPFSDAKLQRCVNDAYGILSNLSDNEIQHFKFSDNPNSYSLESFNNNPRNLVKRYNDLCNHNAYDDEVHNKIKSYVDSQRGVIWSLKSIEDVQGLIERHGKVNDFYKSFNLAELSMNFDFARKFLAFLEGVITSKVIGQGVLWSMSTSYRQEVYGEVVDYYAGHQLGRYLTDLLFFNSGKRENDVMAADILKKRRFISVTGFSALPLLENNIYKFAHVWCIDQFKLSPQEKSSKAIMQTVTELNEILSEDNWNNTSNSFNIENVIDLSVKLRGMNSITIDGIDINTNNQAWDNIKNELESKHIELEEDFNELLRFVPFENPNEAGEANLDMSINTATVLNKLIHAFNGLAWRLTCTINANPEAQRVLHIADANIRAAYTLVYERLKYIILDPNQDNLYSLIIPQNSMLVTCVDVPAVVYGGVGYFVNGTPGVDAILALPQNVANIEFRMNLNEHERNVLNNNLTPAQRNRIVRLLRLDEMPVVKNIVDNQNKIYLPSIGLLKCFVKPEPTISWNLNGSTPAMLPTVNFVIDWIQRANKYRQSTFNKKEGFKDPKTCFNFMYALVANIYRYMYDARHFDVNLMLSQIFNLTKLSPNAFFHPIDPISAYKNVRYVYDLASCSHPSAFYPNRLSDVNGMANFPVAVGSIDNTFTGNGFGYCEFYVNYGNDLGIFPVPLHLDHTNQSLINPMIDIDEEYMTLILVTVKLLAHMFTDIDPMIFDTDVLKTDNFSVCYRKGRWGSFFAPVATHIADLSNTDENVSLNWMGDFMKCFKNGFDTMIPKFIALRIPDGDGKRNLQSFITNKASRDLILGRILKDLHRCFSNTSNFLYVVQNLVAAAGAAGHVVLTGDNRKYITELGKRSLSSLLQVLGFIETDYQNTFGVALPLIAPGALANAGDIQLLPAQDFNATCERFMMLFQTVFNEICSPQIEVNNGNAATAHTMVRATAALLDDTDNLTPLTSNAVGCTPRVISLSGKNNIRKKCSDFCSIIKTFDKSNSLFKRNIVTFRGGRPQLIIGPLAISAFRRTADPNNVGGVNMDSLFPAASGAGVVAPVLIPTDAGLADNDKNPRFISIRINRENLMSYVRDSKDLLTLDILMQVKANFVGSNISQLQQYIRQNHSLLYYHIFDIIQYFNNESVKWDYTVTNDLYKKICEELRNELYSRDHQKYVSSIVFENNTVLASFIVKLIHQDNILAGKVRDILFKYSEIETIYSKTVKYLKEATEDDFDHIPFPWNNDVYTRSHFDLVSQTLSPYSITAPLNSSRLRLLQRRANELSDMLKCSTINSFSNYEYETFPNGYRTLSRPVTFPPTITRDREECFNTYVRIVQTNTPLVLLPLRLGEYHHISTMMSRTNLVNRVRAEYYRSSLEQHFLNTDIDLSDYRYSNLEYFLSAAKNIPEDNVRNVYMQLLFCKLNKKFLSFLIRRDIPFPLGFLVFRPFVVTRVNNAIMGAFGDGGMGFFIVGKSDMMFQDDAMVKSHMLHYHNYFQAVITDPSKLVYMDNLWMSGFFHGHNTIFFKREEIMDLARSQHRLPHINDGGDFSNAPSLLVATTMYQDKNLRSTVDLRLRFPDDKPGVTRAHFVTSAAWKDITQFNVAPQMKHPFDPRPPDTNTVCTQSHQMIYNPTLKALNLPILGKCCIGKNQYDGMVSSVLGSVANINDAVLKDMEYEKLIATHVTAAPRG